MIIGLAGQAGSGKDLAADFLVSAHGFTKVALADPIKRAAADWFDFTEDQLWGPSSLRNQPDSRYPRDHTFGGPDEDCACCGESSPEALCFLRPRYFLQQAGTELGRFCYPDVWVDYALRVAKRLLATEAVMHYTSRGGLRPCTADRCTLFAKGVVISDVRFANEIEKLRAEGAKVFLITRPGAGLKGTAALHQSESELRGIPVSAFDAVIPNDSSINAFLKKVAKLVCE